MDAFLIRVPKPDQDLTRQDCLPDGGGQASACMLDGTAAVASMDAWPRRAVIHRGSISLLTLLRADGRDFAMWLSAGVQTALRDRDSVLLHPASRDYQGIATALPVICTGAQTLHMTAITRLLLMMLRKQADLCMSSFGKTLRHVQGALKND